MRLNTENWSEREHLDCKIFTQENKAKYFEPPEINYVISDSKK